MKLTKRQKELIRSCRKKGYINFLDLKLFYATPQSRKEFLERLSVAGYITERKEKLGRFYFNKKIKEIDG